MDTYRVTVTLRGTVTVTVEDASQVRDAAERAIKGILSDAVSLGVPTLGSTTELAFDECLAFNRVEKDGRA